MSNYSTNNTFKTLVTSINEGNTTISLRGGQGSGKTTSVLQYLSLLAASKSKGLEISIVSDTLPNLKKGPIKEFEKILKDMQLWGQFDQNKTDRIYTHKKTGNYIEFFSVENEGSALGARRTHLYINEVNKITSETYFALAGRSQNVIVDFNPTARFWIDEVLDFPKTKEIVTTFLDNRFLPEKEVQTLLWYKSKAYKNPMLPVDKIDHSDNIKSKYYLNKWKVLGCGEYGLADGLVFTEHEDWQIIPQLPKEAVYIGAGLDFGFSHVSAIVKLYRWNDKIILKENLFKAGMTATQTANHIKQDLELMSSVIGCDESRPETIAELEAHRIPALGVKKGAGSVDHGLDLMHSHGLLITADSMNMLKEFRAYAYATNKHGVSLGVPDKSKDVDNSIDAARYAFMHFLSATAVNQYCGLRIIA